MAYWPPCTSASVGRRPRFRLRGGPLLSVLLRCTAGFRPRLRPAGVGGYSGRMGRRKGGGGARELPPGSEMTVRQEFTRVASALLSPPGSTGAGASGGLARWPCWPGSPMRRPRSHPAYMAPGSRPAGRSGRTSRRPRRRPRARTRRCSQLWFFPAVYELLVLGANPVFESPRRIYFTPVLHVGLLAASSLPPRSLLHRLRLCVLAAYSVSCRAFARPLSPAGPAISISASLFFSLS